MVRKRAGDMTLLPRDLSDSEAYAEQESLRMDPNVQTEIQEERRKEDARRRVRQRTPSWLPAGTSGSTPSKEKVEDMLRKLAENQGRMWKIKRE